MNGRVAKAGTELAVGDIIALRYANRTIEVRVRLLTENPRKEQAEEMYELLASRERDEGPAPLEEN